jgi:acetyl-CoA decarbonylase/synthase, CODH/ACS complex subunit gamma
MALTALEIYKHLPRTNCKECGSPTCLAFAMQLAAKKNALSDCPYVTDEATSALDSASAPPIRLVTIGDGGRKIEIGNETVLFRHDESFYHPTAVVVQVSDKFDEDTLASCAEKIDKCEFERVGTKLTVDGIAVMNDSGSAEKFAAAVKTVSNKSELPLLLVSASEEAQRAALVIVSGKKPLICSATLENHEAFGAMAKEFSCPLAVEGDNLEVMADLTHKLAAMSVEDLVLDLKNEGLGSTVQAQTQVRRYALKKNFRPLGYPTMAFTSTDDPYQEVAEVASLIAKYSGIVVVKGFEPWQIMPALTVRQNIYTDPRKPIQVEAKIYEVGNVDDKSPVMLTTNFSLTYYTVEGEVEASRVPAYIIVIDTEGTSVLTAWASDKLTVDDVVEVLKNSGIADKVAHKKIIIPGYVAVMSAKLEDESGWEVMVGPREASGIPKYLKTAWSA